VTVKPRQHDRPTPNPYLPTDLTGTPRGAPSRSRATKPRSRSAVKQARYRRRQEAKTTAAWVDVGETVYDALARMPGGDDPAQQRACLSALLDLGAAWYLAEFRKKAVTR